MSGECIMALSKKDYLLAIFYGLLGLFFIEIGVLSVYVAIAYSQLKGSAICGIAGAIMVFLGGFLLTCAKRSLLARE
jgi:uncharacterized membrane protein YjjP (DUF1212 family)